ncbi:XdhC/CoxI family protein [Colwellia asteriadis]
MSNRLASLLNSWYEHKDSCQWVLATIIETQRSSYRKSGAMMLINSLGKSYGLLSGGCLEADLMRQAQKCWFKNESITICYDMQDESDIAWQLGIGCGGMVKVLLQPINIENNYHDLLTLKTHIDNRQLCYYQLSIDNPPNLNKVINKQPVQVEHQSSLIITVKPAPALIIFGGGLDAQPLIAMAHTLGWYSCLIDCRTSYARPAYFKQADQIINSNYATLNTTSNKQKLPKADAIVIMHHNIELDAKALDLIKSNPQLSSAHYIGLLGPQHRTKRVFDATQLSTKQLPVALANPIGLDLGGELPESIALAILAQAHAAVECKSAQALGVYQDTSTALHQPIELAINIKTHLAGDIANAS